MDVKTYEVTVRQIEIYRINIEAGSHSEAREIARNLLDDPSEEDKAKYHFNSDFELDTVRID